MLASIRKFRVFHFAIDLLERMSSSGCLLQSAREASGFSQFSEPHSRGVEAGRWPTQSQAIERRNGTAEIAAERGRARRKWSLFLKEYSSNDWLRARRRAMCVLPERRKGNACKTRDFPNRRRRSHGNSLRWSRLQSRS